MDSMKAGSVCVLAAYILAASVSAQSSGDPRIGEWREDRTPTSVGLYSIFEDLGNGRMRHHIAYNLAPQNRLYLDYRCDGNLYPVRNAQGIVTDFSESCVIADDHTVKIKGVRNRDRSFTGPKLDGYWSDGEGIGTISSDGNHYRIVTQEMTADGKVTGTSERNFTRNAERCFSSEQQAFRDCQHRTSPPRE